MTEFESLYTSCFTDVYRYLLKLSSSEQLAEELTSDTFFKAMRSFDSFRGDCPQKIWLLRIAKNCFFSRVKKKNSELSLADIPVEVPADSPGPESRLLLRSEAHRALTALGSISENQREVFMWRFYGELSFREIGAIFGKSENWACVCYHRARQNIIRKMEEDK